MAIRRGRRKLTSLMSSVDRRLKNVELRQNKGIITAAAAATDSNANNNIITPPSGVTSGNTPNPWVHVIDGYWYPAQLTGAASGYDRVELWFEADPLTIKDYGVTVSGVKVLNENDISGTFNVLGDDAPRGADRKSWYVALSNTITNSVLYTTQTTSVYNPTSAPTAKQILSKKLIKSTQANTTTATITFTTSPHYVAGDIISVRDLGSSSSYYGIDGIFKVDSANTISNTITYTFDTPLANAIPSANVVSKYVYGVAQKEVGVGDTWLNTADGLTYYWNGIRYVKWTEGALAADGLSPSPPTGLTLTSTGYNLQGTVASGARSRVTASWTAPTTNTDSSPLEDLVGYRVWYRDSPSADWIKLTKGSETTQVIDNLSPGVTYYFSIIAYDSSGMESTAATGSITTATASFSDSNLGTPSAPILSAPRLGAVTVTWDGRNANNVVNLNLLSYVEVHASTSSGFTPVSSTSSATITAASSNQSTGVITYTTSTSHGFSNGQVVTIVGLSETRFNISNATIANASGSTFTITNSTAANPSLSISGQTGIARTGTLKGKLYSSTDFLAIADLAYNTPYYFKFIFVDISGNLSPASAQSTTTIKPLVDTDLIAAQLNTPLSTWPFANAAVTPGALAAGTLNSSNLFGSNVIVQAAIAANAIGADQIAAGAIVAGKLDVGAVTANTIAALSIKSGDLQSNSIDGMTITGSTIRTAASYPKVEMTTNGITAYNTSNVVTFNIAAGTGIAIVVGGVFRTTTTGDGIDINQGSNGAISFRVSSTNVAHILPNTLNSGITIHTGTTPSSSGSGAYMTMYDDALTGIQIQMHAGNSQILMYEASALLISHDTAEVNLATGSVEIRPGTNGIIYLGLAADSTNGTGRVRSKLVYDTTTSNAANMYVFDSSGSYALSRSTSTRIAKRNIRSLDFDLDDFISISPVIFNYKEGYIREEELEWDIVGFIAEDFIDLGLDTHLVNYPSPEAAAEGEVLQFKYDKLYMFLHKVVQNQNNRIKELESIVQRNNLS